MANSSTVTISLRMNSQGVVTGFQNVGQASQRAGNQVSSSFSRAEATLQTVTRAFKAMQAALAALAVYEVARQITEATLRLQAFQNAMTAVTGSATLAKSSMEFVSQTAQKLGLNLVSLEGAYKNLAGSAMGTSLAGKETEKIFTAVAKASAALGLSAEQTSGSLYAIGQMMSKGTVQAEELKGQLAERLPGAFQMAAKAMGVTTAELQKMLEKGEVMATDLLPKLADELETRFGGAAERAGETARASFERFGNAVENLKRALGESGIVDYLAEIAGWAVEVMNSLSFLLKPGRMGDFAEIAKSQERVIELKKLEQIENENITKRNKEREARLNAVPDWLKATGIFKTEQDLTGTKTTKYAEEIAAQSKYIESLQLKIQTEDNATKKAALRQEKERSEIALTEKQAAAASRADSERKKTASRGISEAERAAKRAAAEAKRNAEEMARIREQAEDDYRKSTLADIDYQKEKIEAEYQQRKKAGYDSVKNERLRQREIQDLEEDRIKEFEKGFEAERDAYEKRVKEMKELEEQRVEEAKRLLEEQQQAYEDFVYDVQSATSDMFMDLFEGGFSSVFDNIETMFRRTLANMAAQAIAEPIIVPVIQSVAGGVGSTISNAMGIPSIAGQSGGFNLGNAGTVYNALTGGIESGVYKALTNGGVLSKIGSGLFGSTAWSGAAGAELGWGASAAATTGMGTTGIAGIIATAAPWAALAAIAVPIISSLLKDEPEPFLRVQTTSTSRELSNPDYKWADGEGKSLAGFDYNLTMQDIGGETQKELGAALKTMLDAQFTAIEETLNVSVNDAIVEAQNAGTGYGDGFFSRIDLRDYSDNVAGALTALTDDLFLDIRDNLTNQLTNGKSSIFNADFFKGIAAEGESAVDTFLRFGKTLETNTGFMEEFTRRTEELGQTAAQAYNAIVAIEQLGAAITGLSSASVANALWESIKAGQSASDFVATLENQVREGVAQATINAFAQSLYSAFLQPINAAVGQMVSSIITGGITTGAALSASMATIRESLNTALEILKNEDFKTLIETFTKELTEAFPSSTDSQVYTPAIYTPPVVVKDTAAEKAAEKAAADTEAERAAAEALQKAQQLKEMMQTIRDSIADSGLSEFWKEAAQLNREMEANIKAANDLGATEAELAEIRTEGTLKAVEALKKWKDEVNDYIASLSNNSELLADTISAYNSAVDNYLKYIDAAKEAGTETELLAASLKEGLLPVAASFKNMFYEVFNLAQTDIEVQVTEINRNAKELVEALQYLESQGVMGLEGMEGFIDSIYRVGEKLVDAQLLNVYKESLSSLGDAQAAAMGLTNEYNLMRMSDRYSTDLTTTSAQKQFVSNFSTLSYDDLLKFSTETGNSFETIFNDITTLSSIINSVSDEFENLQDSLKDYRKSLRLSDDNFLIDPEKKTGLARQEFLELSQRALSSDPAIAKQAMAELPNAAKQLLDLSKKSNTSMLAYNTDMSLVLSSLKAAEDYAATYVDTTDDMTDDQAKALKELQKGHLKDISSALTLVDKDIKAIFDDPELVKFFDDFSTIFGNDIIDSLSGNVDSLVDAINEFTNKDFWVNLGWDTQAAIDFWGSVGMNFKGTFEEAMKLLWFVQSESGGWESKATVAFLANYNGFDVLTLEQQLTSLKFLVEQTGWESKAVVAFISNMSTFNTLPFSQGMSALKFIVDNSGGWKSEATAAFISSYSKWNTLSFEDRMAGLKFISDTTGWTSKATLGFLSNTSAFSTLTFTQAMTALKFVVDSSGGWKSQATASFVSSYTGWNNLGFTDRMAGLKFLVDETGWNSTATAGFVAQFKNDGISWESIESALVEYGFTDSEVIKGIKAAYDANNTGLMSWAQLEAAFKLAGVSVSSIKTLKAVYDGNSTGLNTWVTLSSALNTIGIDDTAVKSIQASYLENSTGLLTWVQLQEALNTLGIEDTAQKTIQANYLDSSTGLLTWASLQSAMDKAGVNTTAVKEIKALYLENSTGFTTWTSLETALNKAAVNSTSIKTLKAIYDANSTGLNTWTSLSSALTSLGVNSTSTKTLKAIYDATSTMSQTEFNNIMTNWDDTKTIEANLAGNVDFNVVSDTLLQETTFNDFAKAFLGISSVWKTAYPSLNISADSETGLYSVIDGLILVFDAIKKQQTTINTTVNAPATTFPSSMQVTGSVAASISSLPRGTALASPLYSYITNGLQISSMPYVNISSMPYVNISSMPAISLSNGSYYGNPLYVYMTNSAMQVYGEVSPYNWGAFGSSLYAGLTAINNNLKSISKGETAYASFAEGGYHSGGLRLVGELGPELEMTGASRIYSNRQTRDLLGSDNIVAAINGLAKRLDKNNEDIKFISSKIKKWDRQRTEEIAEAA